MNILEALGCRDERPPNDEVVELREKLEQVTKERDSFMESYQKMSDAMDDLKQHIADVSRERDAEAIRADQAESEVASLREQMDAANAEAAAMRRWIIDEHESEIEPDEKTIKYGDSRPVRTERDMRLHQILNGTAGRDLLDRHAAEISSVSDELEQCRVQLAGCLTAAEGCTSEPNVVEKGDYGWSLAYQTTLELRKKYDHACEQRRHDLDTIKARDAEIVDLKRDAELCRELREILPSGDRINTSIGLVRIDYKEPRKIFNILISIRDGGAS